MSRLPLPVALLLACALLLAACGGERQGAGGAPRPADDRRRRAAEPTGCEKVAGAAARRTSSSPKPTEKLETGKTYVAHVLTNCGDFEITLDAKRAPKHRRLVQVPGRQGLLRRPDASTASCPAS